MTERFAEKIERRGFPIGIAITREGPYGPTSSRNVYADELTAEELAEREGKGLGYPHPVEIARLTNPQHNSSTIPEPNVAASVDETLNQQATSAEHSVNETELVSPSGDSIVVRKPANASSVDPSQAFRPIASHGSGASAPPDFARHARRCVVCAHPDRDAIEGDFIRWRSPERIAKTYQIADRSSIYRHAHSTGLFEYRKREVGRVLEAILENVEHCPIESADLIVRAARLYTHLNDRGQWVEAPRVQYHIDGPPPEVAPARKPKRARKTLRPAPRAKSLTETDPNSGNR
jgi:hypothetical protein